MRHSVQVISILTLGGLAACATIVAGTSQRVSVNTTPERASCRVLQGGMPVGFVARTPGVVEVERSSNALEVHCTKPGYGDAQQMQASGVTAWVAGNLVVGGLVGLVIDFASGGAYHYESNMMVAMQAGPGSLPGGQDLPSEMTGTPTAAIMHQLSPRLAMTTAAAQSGQEGDADGVQAVNAARFRQATGRDLPVQHGLIRLPPVTPNGDYTYIWPTQSSSD